MPCTPFKIGNNRGFICTKGGRKTKPCFYCGKPSSSLCDFPIGKKQNGKNKDCDRAMCTSCTQKGVSANVDFCREHYPKAKAAYQRRLNKKL